MRVVGPASLLLAALGLAACGEAGPSVGEGGRADATPRALAAVVVEHVGEPRRTTGGWSDPADPLAVDAQVDYGVDPEGTEDGTSHTVRVAVTDIAAYRSEDDRRWLRCRGEEEEGSCEETRTSDGRMLLFRWSRGYEEEEGGRYSWIVVGETEVVVVGYSESDLFDEDPRTLELVVDPADLREAALDPAMSLRTTPEALTAGQELDGYEGLEERPEMPEVWPAPPEQIAEVVSGYVGMQPVAVRPSHLDELGPDAAGAHLRFAGTKRHDAFTVDVLAGVGRAAQVDRPCPTDARGVSCFRWDEDTTSVWELGAEGRPGRIWTFGAQEDDTFNRVETIAVLVTSTALDRPPVGDEAQALRLPDLLLSDLAWMTGDLRLGPERRAG